MQVNSKKIDSLVLILLPILAAVLSIQFNINFLISVLLFSGSPALYLSWRMPQAIIRSVIFALIFSVFGGLSFDYLAIMDDAWYTPTLFSFRILGTIPVEELIWVFLLVYSIVIFYQRFFDKRNHRIIGVRMKYYFGVTMTFFMVFLLLVFIDSPVLKVDYYYLKGGAVLILLSALIFLCWFPRFLGSFFVVAIYFFYAGLLQELTALNLGHWVFPGTHYLGWTTLFGYSFPLEELFFWLVLFSTAVLAHFQFFDDDDM